MDDISVASIRKNARERFNISLREFKGHRMIDLRVWADDGAQESKPTAKGVSINPALLDEVIAALQEARAVAVAKGLL